MLLSYEESLCVMCMIVMGMMCTIVMGTITAGRRPAEVPPRAFGSQAPSEGGTIEEFALPKRLNIFPVILLFY